MTLDFAQLEAQVQHMGASLGDRQRTIEERSAMARRRLVKHNEDWENIWRYVELARVNGAKYRGASPIGQVDDQGEAEALAVGYPLPPCPEKATLIAVDGSQIYPDPHAAALYYLINIGLIVIRHGTGAAPTYSLQPALFYDDDHLRVEGHLIRNAMVNARRTITERDALARAAADHADQAQPLLAVADGPLMFWIGSDEAAGSSEDEILNEYLEALTRTKQTEAALTGYVDRPTSTYVVRMLHLLSLDEDAIDKDALATNGAFEGVLDRMLFGELLAPGERSALFIQRSPTNKEYALRDPKLEIAFFYLNTAMPDEEPYLARVEAPMWVARDRQLIGQVQALLYHQCQLVGRYPYMLARADELAVVQGFERRQLETMIQIELRKRDMNPEPSEKAFDKSKARNAPVPYPGRR